MQLHAPSEVQEILAERLRLLRLREGLRQRTLAERAGVSLISLQRFERTGQGSIQLLLRVCWALGRLDEIAETLAAPAVRSLDDLEAIPTRKRGRS